MFPVKLFVAATLIGASIPVAAACSNADTTDCRNKSELIDALIGIGVYSAKERPTIAMDGAKYMEAPNRAESGIDPSAVAADPVEMQVLVNQVYGINQKELSYDINGYFRMWWYDERLKYSHPIHKHIDMSSLAGSVWTPDYYFTNAIAFDTEAPSIMLYPDGMVYYNVRFSTTLTCHMAFKALPYDSQLCEVSVSTFSSTGSEVQLKWRSPEDDDSGHRRLLGAAPSGDSNGKSVIGDDSNFLASINHKNPTWDIFLDGSEIQEFDAPDSHGDMAHWYRAIIHLSLVRRQDTLINEALIPGIFFMLFSYLGSWMDPKAAPARVAVHLLPVLITINLMGSVNSNLPQIAYTTWLSGALGNMLAIQYVLFFAYASQNAVMLWEANTNAKRAQIKAKQDELYKKQKAVDEREKAIENEKKHLTEIPKLAGVEGDAVLASYSRRPDPKLSIDQQLWHFLYAKQKWSVVIERNVRWIVLVWLITVLIVMDSESKTHLANRNWDPESAGPVVASLDQHRKFF